MAEIKDLSGADASNTARFPENMNPSQVNNGARALEGMLARGFKDTIDGILTTSGTGSAYTATANRSFTASATMYEGAEFFIHFHAACGNSPTLNISTTDAYKIYWPDRTTLSASDILADCFGRVKYSGTLSAWVLMDTPVPAKAVLNTLLGTTINGKSLTTTVTGTAFLPIYSKATGDTHKFYKSTLQAGKVVQRTFTADASVGTGTTVMPDDDSIPQNTEGDEYIDLTITPTSATNRLRITVKAHLSQSAGNHAVYALFQDSTANALAAGMTYNGTNGRVHGPAVIIHEMAAGTTSQTTFKFRAGPSASGTLTFNGESGAQLLGGVFNSIMMIEELLP